MPVPRVLIAEDNPDSRELVADILVSLGYIALAAENGQIALDLVLADPPDLLIQPAVGDIATLDFARAAPAIAAGEEAVNEKLSAINSLLEGVRNPSG